MARHRVVPFDDPNFPTIQRVIDQNDPKYPAIKRRLRITWMKTILGYLAMGGLCLLALWTFSFSYQFRFGFGLLWLLLPVVMWWFSADIAIKMTKSKLADPQNLQHKRVMDAVDRVWKKSGLSVKPPIYASPNPSPNAFATGPFHHKAKVAFTLGLLDIGLTDEEIEAIFAHELAHVRNYDVAFNSFLSVLSSMLFLIVDQGLGALIRSISFFQKTAGIKPERKFAPVWIVQNIISYAIFWAVSQLTKIVQLFVVRARESAADATGAYITGKPCDLAMALDKLVAYAEKNRPRQGERDSVLFRVFRPMMTIDPLFDTLQPEKKGVGVWSAIKRFWKRLQLTHPPVVERVKELDKMNGGKCPRL